MALKDKMQCVILLAVLFCLFNSTLAIRSRPEGNRERTRTQAIFKAWSKMYGLDDASGPPKEIQLPTQPQALTLYPWAPHLEKCRLRDYKRKKSEARMNGKDPSWTTDCDEEDEDCDTFGTPPWIRGSVEDNLAKSAQVQTSIWLRQFPAHNCSNPKTRFLLASWMEKPGHGLGSQLQAMTSALSVALGSGRVLVPHPNTMERAKHDGCSGPNHGSLSCYFFPMVSPECEAAAMAALEAAKAAKVERAEEGEEKEIPSLDGLSTAAIGGPLSSTEAVVVVETWDGNWHKKIDLDDEEWGSPWDLRGQTVEVLGELAKQDESERKAGWWRSQALRFMLRWQTAYLCHLGNIARHNSYGHQVAASHLEQLMLLSQSETTIDLTKSSLELGPWRNDEPFIPRPMVSVHVQHEHSQSESELHEFSSYMWLAERLRLHVPGLNFAWLNTELQSVIEESHAHHSWNFYYTDNPRQDGESSFFKYEEDVGAQVVTGTSFVNLLISSQCDYFIGALDSDWSRLVNELRQTNGRLKAGFLSVNTANNKSKRLRKALY